MDNYTIATVQAENNEYRTSEQFEEILDSTINGNYSQASKECKNYLFNLQDLKDALDEFADLADLPLEIKYEYLDNITSIDLR